MAGTACADSAAGRSLEGSSSVHDSQYGEAMTEWRSSDQVENGMPSTSPPYWDTDDSDDDGGSKPSDLYGKFTWKIEKFSTINKRELKSNAFEIGGYKWYILIYPQGCDVCNHLSLFLCVANHDKLLPGWSHLAQFTIAVVNKDPKKSKYSDTLHRFWKKEHDWGWKKFMELSKVSDGFVDADTLIVKAQVQVVRERADRPFRCLHSQYRREFVRVYLTNVEQICRRFVDDRRDKLGKLLQDKARWSSFRAFWREIDQSSRHVMSREKMDPILKLIVKHFFLEKEVTSTLVMDSLYSGLKALEGQSNCIISKAKALEGEDIAAPVVQLEKDMFILVDDVLSLLERATMDPLPPKDEKGPQNRTKDGGSEEDFYKDSIERDERRLTELGRRTLEIYVLTHIFSKIEAAYQEAVSLKRQEELIREEKAESEQKAKRVMAEKEKRSKKKQGKQKRNNRKAKDKVKDEKPSFGLEDKHIHEYHTEDVKDSLEEQTMVDKDEAPEDASETSDSVEGSNEVLQPDLEDREASQVHWETDTSVVHLSAEASGSAVVNDLSSLRPEGDNSSSVMDDSSSTCSTDSAPSMVLNGSYRGNSSMNNKTQKSPTRGKNQRANVSYREANGSNGANNLAFEVVRDLREQHHTSSDKAAESVEHGAALSSLQEPMNLAGQAVAKKENEVIPVQGKPSSKSQLHSEIQPKEKASAVSLLPQSPPRNKTLTVQRKSEPEKASVDLTPERKVACNSTHQAIKAPSSINVSQTSSTSQRDSVTAASSKSEQQATLISRPSSTPLIPASKPAVAPVISMVQAAQATPFLSRSVSAAGRLGPDSSPAFHSYALQSSRNAISGNVVASSSSSASYPPLPSPISAANPLPSPASSPSPSPSQSPSPSFSRSSTLVPGPVFFPRATEKLELRSRSVNSGISYSAAVERQQWLDSFQREPTSRSIAYEPFNPQINPGSRETFQPDRSSSSSTSGRQTTHGASLADEFPHLDIINDLLDDEQQGVSSSVPDQRFSFPADLSMSGDVGLSTGSCRFERNHSYHEHLFQTDYALQGHHYDTLREYIPQSNMMMPYMNEQTDGLVHNQWQVNGHNLLMPGMRDSRAGDGYLYGNPEYSNLACGLNGYTMFRPSNGH